MAVQGKEYASPVHCIGGRRENLCADAFKIFQRKRKRKEGGAGATGRLPLLRQKG